MLRPRIGEVGQSDYKEIRYVIEKQYDPFEIISITSMLTLLLTETYKFARDLGKDSATALGLTSSSPTGTLGATAYSFFVVGINIGYRALMLANLVKTANDFFKIFVPPTRKHKVMSLKRMLEIIAEHFDYELVTNIEELDSLYYLPSNIRFDQLDPFGYIQFTRGTPTGIPNARDYGYNCLEIIDLCRNLFYAKVAIIDNKLYLLPRKDSFWESLASWQMRSVLKEDFTYNLEEYASTYLMTFDTDIKDDYTIDNYTGTSYEIKTNPKTINNRKNVLEKGLEEINFNVALGTRKDELKGGEKLLAELAGVFDNLINTFGGSADNKGFIENRIGLLKVSNNNHEVPKLLYLEGDKVNRDKFSAKILWEKYHVERSFVQNNYRGQKYRYNNIRVGFGLEDFLQIVDYGYFYDDEGRIAKMESIKWNMAQDFALIDYYVRKPYTKNLEEIFIEQT